VKLKEDFFSFREETEGQLCHMFEGFAVGPPPTLLPAQYADFLEGKAILTTSETFELRLQLP